MKKPRRRFKSPSRSSGLPPDMNSLRPIVNKNNTKVTEFSNKIRYLQNMVGDSQTYYNYVPDRSNDEWICLAFDAMELSADATTSCFNRKTNAEGLKE